MIMSLCRKPWRLPHRNVLLRGSLFLGISTNSKFVNLINKKFKTSRFLFKKPTSNTSARAFIRSEPTPEKLTLCFTASTAIDGLDSEIVPKPFNASESLCIEPLHPFSTEILATASPLAQRHLIRRLSHGRFGKFNLRSHVSLMPLFMRDKEEHRTTLHRYLSSIRRRRYSTHEEDPTRLIRPELITTPGGINTLPEGYDFKHGILFKKSGLDRKIVEGFIASNIYLSQIAEFQFSRVLSSLSLSQPLNDVISFLQGFVRSYRINTFEPLRRSTVLSDDSLGQEEKDYLLDDNIRESEIRHSFVKFFDTVDRDTGIWSEVEGLMDREEVEFEGSSWHKLIKDLVAVEWIVMSEASVSPKTMKQVVRAIEANYHVDRKLVACGQLQDSYLLATTLFTKVLENRNQNSWMSRISQNPPMLDSLGRFSTNDLVLYEYRMSGLKYRLDIKSTERRLDELNMTVFNDPLSPSCLEKLEKVSDVMARTSNSITKYERKSTRTDLFSAMQACQQNRVFLICDADFLTIWGTALERVGSKVLAVPPFMWKAKFYNLDFDYEDRIWR